MSADTMITIAFYGKLAELVGPEIGVSVQETSSVAELRSLIASAHPEAADALQSKRVRACIGNTIVSDSHLVTAGERVEFFPPVSGG